MAAALTVPMVKVTATLGRTRERPEEVTINLRGGGGGAGAAVGQREKMLDPPALRMPLIMQSQLKTMEIIIYFVGFGQTALADMSQY